MATRQYRRRPVFRSLSRILSIMLAGYFGYHAFHGDHGLFAFARVTQELDHLRVEAAEVSTERARLQRRVSLMRTETLDADLLDERARAVLNMAGTDEVVIWRRAGTSREE